LSGWAGTRRDILPLTPEIIDFGGRWSSVIILDFKRREEDNRGKCTDSPAAHHPIRIIDAPTSITPLPILRRMPFLPQPSPIYAGMGQAPNMLDCIPGGLI